jgi:hypothetical protein
MGAQVVPWRSPWTTLMVLGLALYVMALAAVLMMWGVM